MWKGIDEKEALRNCGSRELLLELLGDFYKLIDPKCEKLKQCLEEDKYGSLP